MSNSKTFFTADIRETENVAKWVVENLVKNRKKCVVFLKGDLGSGKTTFVRFALKFLGVGEDRFKGSPTFTVINEYSGDIYHIDLYRIGFDQFVLEYLDKEKGIFFVEWPESLDVIADIELHFEILDEKRRKIDVYTS